MKIKVGRGSFDCFKANAEISLLGERIPIGHAT